MKTSFEYISAFFIVSGFLCAFIMLADIFNNRPQKIKIMNSVWFLTGIWASWIGLYVYFKIGRANKIKNNEDDDNPIGTQNPVFNTAGRQPLSEKILLSTLHCGAVCVLANLIAESGTYFYSAYSGSTALAIRWGLDYFLAIVFGLGFQYAAISPEKRPAIPGKIIRTAFKTAFPGLTAWQAGVFAYSSLIFFGFHDMIGKNSWSFWFMMQIAMFCGCLTAYPVNGLLIKFHIKKTSDKGERPLKHY